jgi:Ser/Thr protein kinase RdoA (MazF antagonist)
VARPGLGTMSDVWLVDCDRGRLVLRGHRAPDWESVEFEHSVMDVARAGGVPVPLALRIPTGELAVLEDGRWWSLLVWVDGHQPVRGSHSLAQARSMG